MPLLLRYIKFKIKLLQTSLKVFLSIVLPGKLWRRRVEAKNSAHYRWAPGTEGASGATDYF